MKYLLLTTCLLFMFTMNSLPVQAAAQQQKTVRIAAFNFYPALFQAKDGSVQGFYVDFLAEIAKREGWNIEYVYGSWADGLAWIKSGEVDVLTNVAHTAERAAFMDFAKTPLLTVWAELYIPKDSSIDGLRLIEGKRIALMKGDFNAASFRNLVEKFGISCQYIEYANFEEVFTAISARQVDGGVVNNSFGAAKQHEFDIKSSGIIFNPFDIYFTVAKGKNREVIDTLDNYLAAWRRDAASPYHQARERWSHGSSSTIQVMPQWVHKVLILFFGFSGIAVIFIVILRIQVNRKTAALQSEMTQRDIAQLTLREQTVQLKKEVEERTLAETSLVESMERKRAIIQSAMDGFLLFDAQGRIVEVNDAYCRMSGYSESELLDMGVADLDAVETEEKISDRINMVREKGSDRFESRHRRKNGSTFDVEISVRILPFEHAQFAAFLRDITEHNIIEDTRKFLAESGWIASGEDFFEALARYLATSMHMDFVCIDKLIGDGLSARTVAVYFDGRFEDNIEYALKDTPCGDVVNKKICCFTKEVRKSFPKDAVLQDMAAESYVGTTLWSSQGQPIGLIAAIGRKPLSNPHIPANILQMVSARAAGELERREAEEALRQSEEKFSEAFRISPVILTISDPDTGLYIEVNDTFTKVMGFTREEVIGRTSLEMGAWVDEEERRDLINIVRQQGECTGFPCRIRDKDGRIHNMNIAAKIVRHKKHEDLLTIIEDVTERMKLETQLIQSQKMESVGRLAGGIAHDYNNMLAVIFISLELIKTELSPDSPLLEPLQEIERAAVRSRDITRQLLAFSRKQVIAPKPTDLNSLIPEMLKSLSRLLGEDIEMRFNLQHGLGRIMVDPSQIDQILVNMSVNARDAMPHGGKLTFETANVDLDEDYCRLRPDSRPGRYVRLSISDNGVGIDKEALANIFEPFFTTKDVGQGTGLGLATVFGIVKQNDGFIEVTSEVGSGTSFRIYIPRMAESEEVQEEVSEDVPVTRGTESILLVEDDEMLCEVTQKTLETFGYKVLAVSSPVKAIDIISRKEIQIDLLLTDVVMPGMNGAQMRDRILAVKPDLKVLFMSGYTSDAIVHRGVLDEGIAFIQKPFKIQELARKVRHILDDRHIH